MVDLHPVSEDNCEEQAADENVRLLKFLYACPVGLMQTTADGTIDMMNPIAMQLLLRLSSFPSANLFEATTRHAPELRNLLTSFSAEQGTVCENHRILVGMGQEIPSEFEVLSCTIVKLGPERFIVTLSDISKQAHQERKLKEAEVWFASFLGAASDFGIVTVDTSGRIHSVSASICKQFGFLEKDLVGQSLKSLEPADTSIAVSFERELALAAREGWHLNEAWHRHQDGSKRWYQRLVAVRRYSDETGEVSGYTVVLRECEQRSIDAHKLKEMLTRDHLTGTYNRMHFFELAERECIRRKRYLQPLSVLIVDIDLFKQVNDNYGHAVGDDVLKQFGQLSLALLRPSDTIARIGGEEFAILLPGTDLDGARRFAERLRLAADAVQVDARGKRIGVTVSIGCAELDDECNLAIMMADADASLYEAKRAGRNRVVARHWSREMHVTP